MFHLTDEFVLEYEEKCRCECVDEDWLHEATGAVPVTSSYTALRLTPQPYDWFPGQNRHFTLGCVGVGAD